MERTKAMTKGMVLNLVKDAMKRKPDVVKVVCAGFTTPCETAEEITEYIWNGMPPGGVGFMNPADEAKYSDDNQEEK